MFLSRAGIKPTATSDEMFEGVENGSDGDEDYFSNADGTDDEDDLNLSTPGPRKKRSSGNKSSTAKKKSKAKTPATAGYDFESSLAHLIRAQLKRGQLKDKQEEESGAHIAALSANFAETAKNLRSSARAALLFPKFEMFLSPEEARELEEMKRERANANQANQAEVEEDVVEEDGDI